MNDAGFRRALGFVETTGVSVAMMAPTAAMALNGALAASNAGPNVPLAFVLAFATIASVAFAFVTFARAYASPASAGEFVERGFGIRAGRLAGWALLLVYLLFTAGSAAEFGAFAASAADYVGSAVAWFPPAAVCLALAALIGTRPATTSSRAMLVVETVSVGAIVALSGAIVARGGAHGLALAPFPPPVASLPGIGLATVFALLSFAGFEGAAVLGAESVDPRRTIPRALACSVAVAGVLYVFVAYAQSIGFGLDARGIAAFAGSATPLGDLALAYASRHAAAAVTAGAAISAFAATLASATGAARLAYAFAREGRLPHQFARIAEASGTPARAYLFVLALSGLICASFAGGRASGTDAFAACGTIAVLSLILVYGAVQIAALRLFAARWTGLERLVPVIAVVSLGVTFAANVFPIPHGPAALYPFVVLAWLALGPLVLRAGPAAAVRAPPSPPP